MRAKLVEDLQDIFKPKPEMSNENLDKRPLSEIIEMVEGKELITLEGYGGENKLGNLPEYVLRRLHKEGKTLENSYHTYETWDHYSLIQIPEFELPKCIMDITRTKTRGSAHVLNIVIADEIIVKEYEVNWKKTKEMKNSN